MSVPDTEVDLARPKLQVGASGACVGLRLFGMSDQGRVRPSNEDCFVIAELARSLRVHQANFGQPGMQYSECRGRILMVADGMGGHNAGEVASSLSMETVDAYLLNKLRDFCNLQFAQEHSVLQEFRKAILEADARLIEESQERPELYGMGTTLTLAFIDRSKLFIAHVGDCRCYILAQGELQQITNDHNMAAEMVRRGTLAPEAAKTSRMRHVITNVLGGNEPGVRVEFHRAELETGDTIMLCSDGLSSMVSDERIKEILQREAEPEAACRQLVAEANAAGGKDNVTVIVGRVEENA